MILRVLVAALFLAQAKPSPVPAPRPLVPGGSLQETLAGGESALFTIDVPANTAAIVTIQQDGVDVSPYLYRLGSERGLWALNLVAGPSGEETLYPAILDAAATWNVLIRAALPRAARGGYVVSFALGPADDRARAVTAARVVHQQAAESSTTDAASFQRARDLYQQAAEAARAAGDAVLEAESTYQHARMLDSLGDTPAALAGQQRALAMFRAAGRRDREARVLNRMGDLSRKMGDVLESERYFTEALPLARATGDTSNEVDILNNSGLLLMVLGRHGDAIEQLAAAVPLAQELNSSDIEGALTHNLGEAYATLGMYDRAFEWYDRSIDLKKRLNLPRRTAISLQAKAVAYYESGDRARADETIRAAVDLYETSGDRSGLASARAFHGQMQHANGDSERAVGTFTVVLPELRALRNRLAEAKVLTRWARIDLDRGDTEAALVKLDEAVAVAGLVGNPQAVQRALYTRAQALQQAGRASDAIASIEAAIVSVEALRGNIQRSEMRTSYLASVRAYFDLYIDLLQRQGNAAAAFAMSERARARTLLEGLAESASRIEKGVDAELLARLRRVQAAMNAKDSYRSQLVAAGGDKARIAAATREITRLVDEWNGLRAKIRTASPAYWALHAPEPVTVERVQASLVDANSAFVEFYLGNTRSYAWVIDRQAIQFVELPGAPAIEPLARKYHDLLSRETEALPAAERDRLAARISAEGRRLADLVWKPIESRVRGKRLVIAADGVLHYVPFAALPSATGAALITRHEIVYVPSASVLDTLRKDSRPLSPKALTAVFADPVFSTSDTRFGADEDQQPASRGPSPAVAWQRLRFSRMEADAIRHAAPGSFQALDFTAAKQTVTQQDLRKYRILHFATHGSLNTEQPELSGLVLSLVDRAGKPVDGFLRLHEIYNLHLDADLVVLSACRTALGKEVYGEGLIGLTRGFMYAGASRVVSSVWNVDDRASARLMERFYAAMLAKGLSPAAALREAQLSLLNEPRWSNPHYWAAFGLQGEWQ